MHKIACRSTSSLLKPATPQQALQQPPCSQQAPVPTQLLQTTQPLQQTQLHTQPLLPLQAPAPVQPLAPAPALSQQQQHLQDFLRRQGFNGEFPWAQPAQALQAPAASQQPGPSSSSQVFAFPSTTQQSAALAGSGCQAASAASAGQAGSQAQALSATAEQQALQWKPGNPEQQQQLCVAAGSSAEGVPPAPSLEDLEAQAFESLNKSGKKPKSKATAKAKGLRDAALPMLPDWQPTTRLLARIGNASDVASAAAGRQDVLSVGTRCSKDSASRAWRSTRGAWLRRRARSSVVQFRAALFGSLHLSF